MCASYGRRADQSLTRTMRIKYMHFAISSHHIAPHIKLVVSNCNDAIAKKNKLCTRDRKPQNYAIQRSMCNGFRVATWNRRKIKSFIAVLWNSEAKHPQTALTTFTLVVALPAVSSLIRVQMKWADHCFHYFLYSQTHRNWIFVVLFCFVLRWAIKMNECSLAAHRTIACRSSFILSFVLTLRARSISSDSLR